ncbi:MAG: DUF5318 family protein [Mycobacteriales bacterium]
MSRSIVDYALQRRAVLADLRGGRVGAAEVCDAHPYLLRAAKYHGETSTTDCPICRRERLTHVRYVYGDQLGRVSGQAKTALETRRLAATGREFTVYVVEVCRSCGWNHLVTSSAIGPSARRGEPAGRSRSKEPKESSRRAARE